MASSGTLTGSFSGGSNPSIFTFYCYWTQAKDYANNQSTITFSYKVTCSNSSYYTWCYKAPFNLYIDNSSTATGGEKKVNFNCTNASGSGKTNFYTTGFSFSTDYSGAALPSVTVTHNSDGTRSVPIKITLKLGSDTAAGTGTITGTIVLDTLYSACGAPSTVSVSGSPVVPGNITVSWSGASAGNNNAITKYRVYYSTSNNVSTSSSYQDSSATSSTSGSITFNASSRGSTYYFKVLTIGTQSGYNSGISSAQASCTVNQLPNAATISDSNRTISSTATVTVTLTRGSDTTGWSSTHICYNWSNSHTGQTSVNAASTTVTINPDQDSSKTLYVWTYDGHEYSAVSTRTITRNKKPDVSEYTFTPAFYLAQNSSNSYVSSVSITGVKCNKSCTVDIEIDYSANSNMSGAAAGYNTTKSGTTSAQNFGSYNINNLLKSYYSGTILYFKVWLRARDSIENGDWKGSTVWAIAGAPSTTTTFDSFVTTSTEPSQIITGKCWNKISVKYLEDASMTTRSVTGKAGSSNITTSITSTYTSGNYRYLNITLPDDISGGSTITLTISLTDGNITKTFTATRTELETPSLGTFTINPGSINMYTTTGNVSLTCTAPCAFENNLPKKTNNKPISPYYITSYSVNVASTNTGTSSRNPTISSATATAEGNTLTVTITKANFANFGEWNKTTYSGNATGYARITFTNKYGRSFTTGYKSYTLSYDVQATATGLALQYGSDYSTTFISGTGGQKIQEGLSVKLTATYTAYTAGTNIITAKFYYKVGNGSWVLIDTQSDSVANGTSIQTKTITSNAFTIPEITSTSAWTWAVDLYSINTSYNTYSITTDVIQHVKPSLTFVMGDPTYTRSGTTTTFKIQSITLSDDGTNVEPDSHYPKFYICDASGTAISSEFEYTSGAINVTYNGSDTWAQKTIKIACRVQVTGLAGAKSKTGYSTTNITVYTDQPTVAYRTNRIGINVSTLENDAAVDINGMNGKTLVYLGQSGTYRMVVDLENLYIDIINDPT